MTTAPAITLLKNPCGFCLAGLHDLCPDAVWNPGGGATIVQPGNLPDLHEGEALYCPCEAEVHEGVTAKCRECGVRPLPGELNRELMCVDRADCELRVSQRLENDPIHQLILECQTTRIVAGEVTERPRRATPEQVQARRKAKAAAVSRPCTCGCGGTTKGGAFLPGHDARYVSDWVAKTNGGRRQDAREALAPFPKLLAKFERRVGS